MPGRSFSSPNYRFGFNGKENDNEVKGITGSQQDYGFRVYDPRLGRFLSVDPLTKSYPMLTPYQFAENQPIWAIDLDGLEKYIIHQRSFAPWSRFAQFMGVEFNGDNRGFTVSTENSIKSKVNSSITVDLAKQAEIAEKRQVYSSQTIKYDMETGKELERGFANPELSVTGPRSNGSEMRLRTRIEGQMPLSTAWFIPKQLNPPIVWNSDITIDNHIDQGYMNVSYSYLGKGFPALEAFIEDEKGTKVFLGAYVSAGKDDAIKRLSGSEWSAARTFNMKLATDSEGGILGVYSKDANGNDIVMNPNAFNKTVESTPAALDLGKAKQ